MRTQNDKAQAGGAAAAPEASVLQISGLRTCLETRKGKLYPVDGVDLDIPRGKIVGLVGESGCGKSMMANSVMGLLPQGGHISEGSVRFCGNDFLAYTAEQRRLLYGDRMTLIFQEPMSSLNPVIKVGPQVLEVVMLHKEIGKEEAKKQVIEMFRSVGIPEPERRYNCYPHELSGGLRQRVMISAAMICRPDLLIADEPTTALDVTIEAQILQLMRRLQQEAGTSILLITHDLGVVAEICDMVYVMYAGKIVETADVYELFHNPKHPYTRGLLGSLPSRNTEKRLQSIPGTVPMLAEMPQGCRFAPRCQHAADKCRQALPSAAQVHEGHRVSCWMFQKEE
ncbi:ABC transporter ATP-binding protein [Oscillibacter sp. MSJ-2]|uniref:ABC transporter ATP-binding protein n=1 Tax=Dysosmobacter acutus TaxID=2841504 RepID=A0ABS6F892_9FIRM|nr:ABC transporter ATP-binding protein [Dysosmobacter acutus]MBU5626491.1 ABC transporter ATP-binding protein [Dysosmobacter acutus]